MQEKSTLKLESTMAYPPKTTSPARGKKPHESTLKGETAVQDRQAVVDKKKSAVIFSVAKRAADVLLKRRLLSAKSVMKMKKPSLKTILKDADDFERRLQTGETRVLTREESDRRL